MFNWFQTNGLPFEIGKIIVLVQYTVSIFCVLVCKRKKEESCAFYVNFIHVLITVSNDRMIFEMFCSIHIHTHTHQNILYFAEHLQLRMDMCETQWEHTQNFIHFFPFEFATVVDVWLWSEFSVFSFIVVFVFFCFVCWLEATIGLISINY